MVYQYPLSVMARTVDDVLLPSSLKYILIFMSTTCCSEYLTFIYLTCSISSNNPMRIAHSAVDFSTYQQGIIFKLKSPSFRSATGGSFLEWCITSIILYNNRSYGYKRKPFQKLFQIKIPRLSEVPFFNHSKEDRVMEKILFKNCFKLKFGSW